MLKMGGALKLLYTFELKRTYISKKQAIEDRYKHLWVKKYRGSVFSLSSKSLDNQKSIQNQN